MSRRTQAPAEPRRRRLSGTVAAFLTGLALIGSLRPSSGPLPVPHLDKLIHFSGYALLTLSYLNVFRRARAVFLAFGLGALIEILQMAVPERTFSVGDLAFNGMGVALGFWAYGRAAVRIRMELFFEAISRPPRTGRRR